VDQFGSDGTASNAQPNRFVSAGAAYSGLDVGKYLVTYGATNDVNNGLRKVVAVIGTDTLILTSGIRAQPFVTEVGMTWRLIDPTVLDGSIVTNYAVIEGGGTLPGWQLALTLAPAATTIGVQVQPLGNWNTGTHTPSLGLTQTQHEADATPSWYFRWDGFTLSGWTVTTAGTGAYRILYAGYAQSFHAANDPSCAVQINSAPGTLATTGSELLSDDSTVGTLRFLTPTIAGTPVFAPIATNPFDLRVDAAAIAFGSAAAQNEIRGVLSGLVYCSTGYAYKAFVSNTRSVLSLGNGYGIAWDSALVV